ncbi:hypothetical protein C8J57DRAFT_1458509 [Mycena rebaudengoi]|nr:hypothetical protein C8J57DRAFT_1458509 [Mycena rebaudengoi]
MNSADTYTAKSSHHRRPHTRALASPRTCSICVDHLHPTSCWNPSTVSLNWKRTSREIVADWSRWNTGGPRVLKEGDKASGADWARGGEAARGGLKGGVAREDVGDSEACMVWAMPPLPAACLAHIGALGLGTFAEDKAEEYVDTEEEEGSNEGEVDKKQRPTNRHVMDIHGQTLRTDRRSRFDCNATYLLSFFKPFDLIPILVADVVITRWNRLLDDFNMSDKVGAIWISYGCQLVEGWNSGCREKLATSWRNCGTSFYKMWTSAGRSSWRQRDGTLAV